MTVGKPNFNLNSFGIKYLSKEEVQELLNKAPPMDMRSASERHASNESQRKTGVSNIQNEVNLTSMHGDNTKPAGSGSTGFGKKISGTVKPAKLKPSTNAKIDSQRASNIKEIESKKPTATETKDTKFVYNKPRSVSGEGMYRDGKGTHETQSDGKTPSVASPPKGSIGRGNRAVPVSSTGNVKGKERKHVTEAGDDKNEKTEAVAGTMVTNPKDGKQRSSARIQWEKRGGQGDPDEKRTPANVKSTGKQRGKLSGYKRDRIVSDAKRSALENIKTDKETAKKWGEAEDKYPASENKDDRTHLDEQYKHVNGHYYHDGKPEKHAETTDKITAKRKKDKIDMEAGRNSRHRKDAAQTAGGVDAEANTKEQTAGESYYGDSDPDKDPLDKRQEGTKEEREEKEEARDDDPDETGYDHKDEDFDDRDESSNESDSGSKTGKHDNSSESGFESESSLNRRIASNEEKRRKGAKEAKSKKKTPEEEKEDKRISGYERAGQKGKKGLKGSSDGSSRPDPARKEDAVNRFDGTPNVYPEAAKRAASKESKKSSDIIMDMNIMKLNLMNNKSDDIDLDKIIEEETENIKGKKGGGGHRSLATRLTSGQNVKKTAAETVFKAISLKLDLTSLK